MNNLRLSKKIKFKEIAVVGSFIGAVLLSMYPIFIHPYIYIDEYSNLLLYLPEKLFITINYYFQKKHKK